MSETPHLFGLPGAELLYDDASDVYESDIEPWLDEREGAEWVIEEHTTRGPTTWLPSKEWVQDWIAEAIAEEHDFEDGRDMEAMTKRDDTELLDAIDALLAMFATRCKWLEADKKIAEHVITIDGGEPYLDGEPMYRKNPDA